MERSMSATEARVHFGELLESVASGGPVVVERGGRPHAVVLGYAQWQQLHGRGGGLAAATVIRDRLHARLTGSVLDVVAELDAARQERDEQLERVVRGRQLPASGAD